MTYKLTIYNSVIRQSDGACIPFAVGNTDYAAYLAWVAQGNAPLPADPPTAEQLRDQAKAARAQSVSKITVTTTAGNTFDGNEEAQERMDRAAGSLRIMTARLAEGRPVVLSPDVASTYRVVAGLYEMIWVLADNRVVFVGADELAEAVILSGAAQAAIWVIP